MPDAPPGKQSTVIHQKTTVSPVFALSALIKAAKACKDAGLDIPTMATMIGYRYNGHRVDIKRKSYADGSAVVTVH